MHNLDLILTLTSGLAAALVLGYITHRLGLSPLVGYLLAGTVVGPRTPGFAADPELAEQMAEIGVILLMFGVGLHFDFAELFAVRRIAVPGAVGQSLFATILGAIVAVAFGWGWSAGLVFGLAISVASTVVLLRVLVDNNDLQTPTGHIAVGWLVVEDLFTVLVLVLLPVLFQGHAAGGVGGVAVAFGWSIAKIGLLIGFIVFAGGRVLPWLLGHVAATRSRELFTLTVLVVALGMAVSAAKVFGVSMALGAFLAGMVVGRSDFAARAASEALPMRDAFAVLFFVSVGMLFDPMFLVDSPLLVLATLAVILIGKPLAAIAIVLFLRAPLRVALSVAVALAQIGEFSFILAALGEQLNILPEAGTNALIASAILSISLNPILYPVVGWFEARAKTSPKLWAWLTAWSKDEGFDTAGSRQESQSRDSAIVVGYGPVGRTLVRLLQQNEIEPVIVELNLTTVHRLRSQGLRAVYGDCTHQETVLEAGAETAVAFLLTSAGMQGSEEAIRQVRESNPKIRVFARANYLREVSELKHAGADVVFSGEGEVALAMAEYVLRQLGATDEQIDREQERVRKEFLGGPLAETGWSSAADSADPQVA